MKQANNTVQKLSTYKVGQSITAAGATLDTGRTKPPARYTESSLINDMTHAYKFAKTKEEQELLKQTEGVGTSRTRAPLLKGLITRKLLTSKKKGKRHELQCAALGREILSKLPEFLMDVGTTAKWEMVLTAVEKGQAQSDQVIESQIAYVQHVVDRAREQMVKK